MNLMKRYSMERRNCRAMEAGCLQKEGPESMKNKPSCFGTVLCPGRIYDSKGVER
jgi:hypothetical protein